MAMLAAFALLFAARAWFTVREFVDLYEADTARDHRVLGRALSAAVAAAWVHEGLEGARATIAAANEEEPETTIRLVEPGAAAGSAGAAALPEAVAAALGQERDVIRVDRSKSETGHFYTYSPVRVGGRIIGALEFSDSLRDEQRYAHAHTVETVFATAGLVLLCGAIAWILGMRFVGKPVARLIAHSQRVGAGDLESRIQVVGHDELSELGAEMNTMTERLAEARLLIESETGARIAALEALQHADRLTTVGRLASGIAHELGTPMNVVSGRAQMIAAGEVETKEEVRAAAVIITEQVRRMTRILRQLLDFTRRRGVQPVQTDLSRLVGEAATLLTSLAEKRRVRIRAPEAGEALHAWVDPDQINQVVVNLLMNAVQASGPDSEVRVRATHQAPEVPGGSAWACIEVEDDGIGMTPEVLERVFDPFFTTKPVGEGTGLGLSVAYGIVADHGGRLEAESISGHGSRFRVVLPECA